jgi:choline dehydrogenase-like flavoprotein
VDDAAAPETWDYVVVGSGAGGGTVAARLADYGHSVLVLEAGGLVEGDDYDVPAFHPFASEDPAMSWNFYVRHLEDGAADWKYQPDKGGVLYPRASTVGGCTAHNAMIFIRPDDADWQAIADATGDPSWSPRAMDRYFRRLERCRHRKWPRLLSWFGIDYSGHGWKGWLTTERALPRQAKLDPQLVSLITSSAQAALLNAPRALIAVLRYAIGRADPNARNQLGGKGPRVWYTPMTTDGHRRTGTRERLAAAARSGRLEVRPHCLATRVILDGENRATGVSYLEGERLYRASPKFSDASGRARVVHARREVILAGGAINTPQLLMLSGIGPKGELADQGVRTVADLPVGRNLQDRYEVSVVNRLTCDWKALEGARFDRSDRLYAAWRRKRGMYISNGAAVALAVRSPGVKSGPRDLFLMAMLAPFRGYYPKYSDKVRERRDCLSWTILKARTANRGVVRLRSADPRDPPVVDFKHFEGPGAAADLAAITHAVQLARKLAEPLGKRIAAEEDPGPNVSTPAEIEAWVRASAWGHHAACTCPIGSVLDAELRVLGTGGLRVVDASAFPTIPGFFIACAVYMLGEKAADIIHAHARKEATHAPAAAA